MSPDVAIIGYIVLPEGTGNVAQRRVVPRSAKWRQRACLHLDDAVSLHVNKMHRASRCLSVASPLPRASKLAQALLGQSVPGLPLFESSAAFIGKIGTGETSMDPR
jgi:hypothetical protein